MLGAESAFDFTGLLPLILVPVRATTLQVVTKPFTRNSAIGATASVASSTDGRDRNLRVAPSICRELL